MKIIEVDKLISWIQANQRDEASVITTPPPQTPPPQTPPPTTPPPGTGVGNESNPYVLSTPISIGYGYEKHEVTKEILIPAGQTMWFKVDPALIPNLMPPKMLWLYVFNYDAYEQNISGTVCKVDRASEIKTIYSTFTPASESQFSIPWVKYAPSYYYMIAAKNIGNENQLISVWWKVQI